MTATPADWRVQVKKGDVLSMQTTYDSSDASWYESMGIMVVWMADGDRRTDPFTDDGRRRRARSPTATCPRTTTTAATPRRTARRRAKLPSEPTGDHDPDRATSSTAAATCASPDSVADGQGRAVAHVHEHRRTADQATASGTRSPRARHRATVDRHRLPARRRRRAASTPASSATARLTDRGNRVDVVDADRPPPGTYTYFCRIHPFMRGAFRVTP